MSLLNDDTAVKEAFKRVKEHMASLEKEVRANREFIIAQNKQVLALEGKIKELGEQKKEEKTENKGEITSKEKINGSIKGKGDLEENFSPEEDINYSKVQSSKEIKGSLATPRRHLDSLSTAFRHPGIDPDSHFDTHDIEEIKQSLNKVFLSLTNREFKVFMAVYSLQEQHNSPTTYAELAQNIGVSASSIRDYISELVRKGAPLKKEKSRNGLTYVSVLPEFKSLNLISKLIAFRNMSSEQKSLFDTTF
ncbi:MAG TPA: winged helix-turn-helix domain-containing protein [Nanoarchaeota archaeon]|nr:winged helix-turn-helix domain-containing protein [Candidatus Woesearchaeota archaeon]HIH58953.1 winged helix-turn-helix domain-containing protein [Nanoarchaeota archaeon]HII14220.1 winged helix-turn-helix domain-containing protein [Nanoarchaeota archaeon]